MPEQVTLEWSPELREFRDLSQRVTFSDYVSSAIDEAPATGAAAEYNDAVFGRTMPPGTLPVEMLMDRDGRYSLTPLECRELLEAEHRTIIGGVGSTNVGSALFAGRLMSDSEGAHIGATFPLVGPGSHSVPIISTTTIAASRNRAAAETAAGTLNIVDAVPERFQLSYEYAVNDELQLPGVGEGLRADLRRALRAGLDNRIITQLVTALSAEVPSAGTTVESYDMFMERLGDFCDGRGAGSIEEMRCLLGSRRGTDYTKIGAFRHVVSLVASNGGTVLGSIPPGVVRSSQHIAPLNGSNNRQDGLFYNGGPNGPSGLICPIWRGAQLLRDESRLQLDGQITLTGAMYADVIIASTDAYRRGVITTA